MMKKAKECDLEKKEKKKVTATVQLPIVSALCMPLFDSPRATMDFLCPLVSYPIWSISRSIEIDPFIGAMFSRVTNKRRNLIFHSRTLRRADQTCEKIKIPILLREKTRNFRLHVRETHVPWDSKDVCQ